MSKKKAFFVTAKVGALLYLLRMLGLDKNIDSTVALFSEEQEEYGVLVNYHGSRNE